MVVGLGVDIIELERIRAVYDRHGERFLDRILTAAEKAYCLRKVDPVPSLAGRFAVKEAGAKALGTGIARGVAWREIEVVRAPSGAPGLAFHGAAHERAAALGVSRGHVTISHGRDAAVAVVVLESIERMA